MASSSNDWIKVTSPTSGRAFLWNARTSERRMLAPSLPQPPPPPPPMLPRAAAAWRVAKTPDQRTYYYNEVTREVRWSAESAAVGVAPPPPPQPTRGSSGRARAAHSPPLLTNGGRAPLQQSAPPAGLQAWSPPAFATQMESVAKMDSDIAELGGRVASLRKAKSALIGEQRQQLETLQANVATMLGTLSLMMETPVPGGLQYMPQLQQPQPEEREASPPLRSPPPQGLSSLRRPHVVEPRPHGQPLNSRLLPRAHTEVLLPTTLTPPPPPPTLPLGTAAAAADPAAMRTLVDTVGRCAAAVGSRRRSYDDMCAMLSVVTGSPSEITSAAFAAVIIRYTERRLPFALSARERISIGDALVSLFDGLRVCANDALPNSLNGRKQNATLTLSVLSGALCALFELPVHDAADALFCCCDDLMGDGRLGMPEIGGAFSSVLAAAKSLGRGHAVSDPRETGRHLATELLRAARSDTVSKAEFVALYSAIVGGKQC